MSNTTSSKKSKQEEDYNSESSDSLNISPSRQNLSHVLMIQESISTSIKEPCVSSISPRPSLKRRAKDFNENHTVKKEKKHIKNKKVKNNTKYRISYRKVYLILRVTQGKKLKNLVQLSMLTLMVTVDFIQQHWDYSTWIFVFQ